MPMTMIYRNSATTRRSPLPFFHRFLFALAGWVLAVAPLGAQTSDTLNYVDHINVDFAHNTMVSTNVALTYRDKYGDLQGPPAGARTGSSDLYPFYLFSTKDIHILTYNTSESPTWVVSPVGFGAALTLSPGTEVSYTPISTGRPPPTNGPDTIYDQLAILTGPRNALYSYNLIAQTRAIVTMGTDPSLPPYIPGNALLAIDDKNAILTTGYGSIATVDKSTESLGSPALVTPLISAQGSGPGELNNPSALAIGPDKLLYVLDAGNNRIQKFTVATGEYQGGFSLPSGMTVFTTAATVDTNGGLVYNGNGTNVLSTSMAISAEGHIYLGDGLGGGFVFSLDGNLLANFHPPEPDGTWVDGGLIPNSFGNLDPGVGSYLQYDGMGNVFTYVEGKGIFRYRDPSFDELDFVNLTVGDTNALTVTSGPGVSVVGSLSFRNDLSANFGTLTIVDPVTVRTGNLYVQHDVWGRDSTGVIEGGTLLTAGDMHKINGGTLILNNVNTYTGKTIIDDGKLIVNGSIAGGAVVTEDAILGGSGVIGGNTTIQSGGILSPGNSPGTLTFEDNLTLDDGSIFLIEAGDLVDVNGLLTLEDGWTLTLTNGFQDGGSMTLFTYDTLAWSGSSPAFDISSLGFTPTGPLWLSDTGSAIMLHGISAVPEPSIIVLMALGGAALLARNRRKILSAAAL